MRAGRAVRAPSATLRTGPYWEADVTLGYDRRDFVVRERQRRAVFLLIRKNVGGRTKKVLTMCEQLGVPM